MNLDRVTTDRPKTGSAALSALRSPGCATLASTERDLAPAFVRQTGAPSDPDVWHRLA